MAKPDTHDVAKIHCEALPDDFLASLGASFLTTLYRCIISLNIGFGVVFEKDHHIVGVAIATENNSLFYKSLLLRRFWMLMPKVMWALVKHPRLIKKLLETLLYSKQESCQHDPEAELIVIVLRKDYQRQGIGTKILSFLNEELLRRGKKSYVVRIYADNEASNRFYVTAGFKRQDSYLMYNREWNLYKYDIYISI